MKGDRATVEEAAKSHGLFFLDPGQEAGNLASWTGGRGGGGLLVNLYLLDGWLRGNGHQDRPNHPFRWRGDETTVSRVLAKCLKGGTEGAKHFFSPAILLV